MKAILIPVEDHPALQSILQTALVVAQQFGSHMEGVPLVQDIPALAIEMTGAWALASELSDPKRIDSARRLFEDFMLRHDVGRDPHANPSFRWSRETSISDSQLGSYGRVFDAIVVGRPDLKVGIPRRTTLESALFDSGRLLVVAPPSAPNKIGSKIVIAWNASTETARAIGLSMAFLRQAEQVTVLTIEGGTVEGPSGEKLAQALRLDGIAADAISRPTEGKTIGEAILDNVAALGADLLIKGAYTQSRIRQMIFGGATNHILSQAALPVLMTH
jgi:nucleotide-binding universal stress UspA family protein